MLRPDPQRSTLRVTLDYLETHVSMRSVLLKCSGLINCSERTLTRAEHSQPVGPKATI